MVDQSARESVPRFRSGRLKSMADREPPKPYAAPVHPLPGPGGTEWVPAGESNNPEDGDDTWAFDAGAGDETESEFGLNAEDEKARRERLAAPSVTAVVAVDERDALVRECCDAVLTQRAIPHSSDLLCRLLAERLGVTVEEAGAELDADLGRRRAGCSFMPRRMVGTGGPERE